MAPSTVVLSLWSLSSPVRASAGAAAAGSPASSDVPIVGKIAVLGPVDEPECESMDEPMELRLVEEPVCSGSTESCVAPSEAGFSLVSKSVVVVPDCVDVAVEIDCWLLKCLKIMQNLGFEHV